jgi:hypothetical protein
MAMMFTYDDAPKVYSDIFYKNSPLMTLLVSLSVLVKAYESGKAVQHLVTRKYIINRKQSVARGYTCRDAHVKFSGMLFQRLFGD